MTKPIEGAPATEQVQRWSRHITILAGLALPVLIALLISACDSGGGAPAPGAAQVHVTATLAPDRHVPDPPEVIATTAAGQLPNFVTGASASIQALYQGAITHADAYSHVPCFCGCALYQHAHTSLLSCFVKSTAADGSITWTDHGTSCDICTGIAQMTLDEVGKGTPLPQIWQLVYTKFKYTGVWTDTPPAQ